MANSFEVAGVKKTPGNAPGLRFGAIVVGLVVDLVLTFVLVWLFGIAMAPAGVVTPDQVKASLHDAMNFNVAATVAGLISSGVGGYVAAAVAGASEIRNAFALGVIATVLSGVMLAFLAVFPSEVVSNGAVEHIHDAVTTTELMVGALGAALTIPACLLGGFVRSARD